MNNKEYTTKLSTPGERLKYIRTLAQLTRESTKEKFNISSATLRSWEDNKVNISDEKIRICLEAYKSVGILTNVEWIKTGEGMHPVIQGQAPKFIEKLLLSSDEFPNEASIDKEFLKNNSYSSQVFISYIDREEKFTFINEKYQEVFNKTANEILGKTLQEMIGEQGYKNVKPYIDKAFNGEEVIFEYPWKYGENQYRYLKLNFIPHIVNEEVTGFFSFMEDKEPPIAYGYLNMKIEEFMLKDLEQNIEYNNQLFIDCINLLYSLLQTNNAKITLKILNKMALNLYSNSLDNQIPNKEYAINMVKMLRDLNFIPEL